MLSSVSQEGMLVPGSAAISGLRRLNGKNLRAPALAVGPMPSPELPGDQVNGCVASSTSSLAVATLLQLLLRLEAKSLKSTVLERIDRRMLGWRVSDVGPLLA